MKRVALVLFAFLFLSALLVAGTAGKKGPGAAEWAFNATAIEACSCPMFCQCYFNMEPAGHHEEGGKHFCRANIAYKVNKGHYGNVRLDNAKFWMASDLGGDFSKGQMDWAVVIFDKATTPEQRDAIGKITAYLFPVQWKSLKTAEGNIDRWEYNKDMAVATLDGGKTAEVRLRRAQGNTDQPVVINNLKYWAAPRNDGFVLMPNEIEAYRGQTNAFEYKGTNGFMITIDLNANDFPQKSASKGK